MNLKTEAFFLLASNFFQEKYLYNVRMNSNSFSAILMVRGGGKKFSDRKK